MSGLGALLAVVFGGLVVVACIFMYERRRIWPYSAEAPIPARTARASERAQLAAALGFTQLAVLRDARGGGYRLRFELWLADGGDTMMVLCCGSLFGLPIEGSLLHSLLDGGGALSTVDDPKAREFDLTRRQHWEVHQGKPLDALVALHRGRLAAAGRSPVLLRAMDAVDTWRGFFAQGIELLVARGWARVVDPARGAWRYTPKGALLVGTGGLLAEYRRLLWPAGKGTAPGKILRVGLALAFVLAVVQNRPPHEAAAIDSDAWLDQAGSHRHLVPGLLGDARYQAMVADRLRPQDFQLGMIELPSFGLERLVGVAGSKDGLHAVVVTARSQIWSVRSHELYPDEEQPHPGDAPRLSAIGVDRLGETLMPDVALELRRLWALALSHVHRPRPEETNDGNDGVIYEFFADTPSGRRLGRTWSPRPGTPMAALVQVGSALATYASTPEPRPQEVVEALRSATRAAFDALAADVRPASP